MTENKGTDYDKLRKLIKEGLDGDQIKEKMGFDKIIKVQSAVKSLMVKDKKFYEIPNLYGRKRESSPYVKFTKSGIYVLKRKFDKLPFKEGSQFEVEWTDKKITLKLVDKVEPKKS